MKLSIYRLFKVVIKIISVLLLTAIVSICLWLFWYNNYFFPADDALHEKAISNIDADRNIREDIEFDLIQNIQSAKTVNPVLPGDMEKIEKATQNKNISGFSFYHNPYGINNSILNQKVTVENKGGMNQKNSILLKNNSRISYQLKISGNGEHYLDFHYIVPDIFSRAGDKYFLTIESGKAVLFNKEITAYRSSEFTEVSVPHLKQLLNPKTIIYYIHNPMGTLLNPDCGWRNEKVKIPNDAQNLTINFNSNKSGEAFLCIGTPRIYHASEQRNSKQNVIFLLFDELQKSNLDLYEFPELTRIDNIDEFIKSKGNQKIISPVLDRKAKDSLIFNNMFTNGAHTLLSIVSIWTSRPFSNSGLPEIKYRIVDNKKQFYDERFDTLPSLLLKKGYITSQISNNSQSIGSTEIGIDLGFEECYDYGLQAGDKTENFLRIYDFLKDNRYRNFMLYAHINNPHQPHWVPMKYFFKALLDTDFNIRTTSDRRACLEYLNFSLKNIFRVMEKLGLDKNTTVIITSDHGTYYYYNLRGKGSKPDEMIRKRISMKTDPDLKYIKPYVIWTGNEQYLYNNLVNIPFVIIPPKTGRLVPGKVLSAVQMIDVAPTLLELLTGEKSRTFKGKSFYNMLIADTDRDVVHDAFIPVFGKLRRGFIADGRYKYWRNLKGLYASTIHGNEKRLIKSEFLFDLKNDPYEIDNLAVNGPQNTLLIKMRKLYYDSFPEFADKNIIQIMPGKDGKEKKYTVRISTENGSLVYPEADDKHVIINKENNKAIAFEISVKDKKKIVSFETRPYKADLKIEFIRNGKLIPVNEIFTGQEILNIKKNPVKITTSDDMFFSRSDDIDPVLPLYEGSVWYIRMPLEFWLAIGANESSGLTNINIKEQLKSWGYIQ